MHTIRTATAFLILGLTVCAFPPLPEPDRTGISSYDIKFTVESQTVESTIFYPDDYYGADLILWLSEPFGIHKEKEFSFIRSIAEHMYTVAVLPLDTFPDTQAFADALQENAEDLVENVNSALLTIEMEQVFLPDKVIIIGVGLSASLTLHMLRFTNKDIAAVIAISPPSLEVSNVATYDGFLSMYLGDDDGVIMSNNVFHFEDELRQANISYEVHRYSTAGISVLDDDVAWTRTQASILHFIDTVSTPSLIDYVKEPLFSTNIDTSLFRGEMVPYADNGVNFQGYIAYPTNASSQPLPLVVIGPDWDGIGEYEIWRAKLLAQWGYVAFVADIYGSSIPQGPSLPIDQRVELTRTYSGEAYIPRMLAAIRTATETDLVNVDDENIALIGYCFGGTGILQVARRELPGLRGIAAFHPGMIDLGTNSSLPCYPLATLILAGADDPSIPQEEFEMFREEFNNKSSIWEYVNYGDTRHAFTDPEIPRDGAFARYNPYADVRSFTSLEDFLKQIFEPEKQNLYEHCKSM